MESADTNAESKSIEKQVVSVVVPYSPSHTPKEIFEDAIETANSQSVPTELVVVRDTDQRGPSWARNRGLDRADTRYVALLDADDYWHEDKLESQLSAMRSTGAGICAESYASDTSTFIRELYLGNISSLTSSVLIDTEQLQLRFEESLGRREDHLFILEAAANTGVCFVQDCFTVGGHEESLSQGTSNTYRLMQDYYFSRHVRERVPEVRRALKFYERPRCNHGFKNTPGDLYRLALQWPSLSSFIGMAMSIVCQRLL